MLNLKATGISVRYGYGGGGRYGWVANLAWQDDKFAENSAVEGEIRTRYFESTISKAIDCVVGVVKQFNVPMWESFYLYYEKDGVGLEEAPPKNWRSIVVAEATIRGWQTYGGEADKEDMN